MTKLAGTAGSLVAVGVGVLLTPMMRSSTPGLVVMLAGAGGLTVVLIRSVRGLDRQARSRRARAAAQPDRDRAYFDALSSRPNTNVHEGSTVRTGA